MRTITLKIKIPQDVTVVTEFERIGGKIDNSAPRVPKLNLNIDLTTKKTSAWLQKKDEGFSNDGCCCCVRG